MIYVDVSPEHWLKKYPELSILKKACDHCGTEMICNKPFIQKDYAGFAAAPCACGKNRHTCMSMIPTSESANLLWRNAMEQL